MDAQVQRLLPQTLPADLEVWLPGQVKGKGRVRARVMKVRGRDVAHMYPDPETVSYEAELKFAAEKAMDGRRLIDEGIRCRVTAIFAIPATFTNQKRALALEGHIRHIVKPDGDNLMKCVGDAFNKIVWVDDSRVCDWVIRKYYGEHPGLFVEIWCLGGALV